MHSTNSKKIVSIEDITPKGLELFPYQKIGVKRLVNLPRALLADEMGLGKSPQAIVASNAIRFDLILILCPASVRSVWKYEYDRWNTCNRKAYVINSGAQTIPHDASVVICSYSISIQEKWIKRLKKFITDSETTLLICDEAHELKSWKAKRTKVALIELGRSTNYVWLLTGTPMKTSVTDLHSLATCCEPRYLGGKWGTKLEFSYYYSYAHPTPYGEGIEFRGIRNVEELRQNLSRFMIRRYKVDVQPQLPPKMYNNVYLDIGQQADLPKTDREKIVEAIVKQVTLMGTSYATLRHDLGVSKTKPFLEWLDTFIEANPKEPLVIFAIHKQVVKLIAEHLTKNGIRHGVLTGDTSPRDRGSIVESFQSGEISCFVGNIIAAGTGITLHRACNVIFAELDWTPANLSQAADRLHRIGQKRTVNVWFMLALGTIDEDIIDVIQQKMKDTALAVGRQ